jgi:molybdate transport system substrate-binding protein
MLVFGCLSLLGSATAVSARAEDPVTVFAAASLKGAMGDISDAWAATGHPKLRLSLDSSGTLAKQIQQGAGAQIFISADEKWMDYLAKHSLVVPDSRKDLLTNGLVLVAPAGQGKNVTIAPGLDLASVLGPAGRLAVGDPDTVPAGIYAKQALIRLGAWAKVSGKLAPAANVKAALLLVERGEAPAGVVYRTDALGDPKVQVIGAFPASSHDPIAYPIALISPGGDQAASAALAFLEGKQAKIIYAKYGFGVR